MKGLLKWNVSSMFVRRFSSFTYLNVTQFLGALNDNIYKFLIVYFLIEVQGIENSHRILSLTGATFVLPFILFSASSGVLADRFSKRNIIVFTKVLELVVMLSGLLAFALHSIIGSYFVLFMMATQSALFGPSKYGILPELVSTDRISRANGMMSSFTFLAIILGTFFASFLMDITGRNFILGSLFCVGISIIGLATSICIEYTPPSGSHTRFNILFLSEVFRNLKFTLQVPSLLAAVLGSSFFLFLGAFVQLNMIPFAVQSLHLTDIQGGYLFLLTALGIGAGAMVAGRISGKTVELGLVPVAGFCITVCCFLLDFYSDTFYPIVPLVILLGFFGGIWQIPLDSYIQVSTPHQKRGQIVAATNFLSFVGVLLASFLVYAITEVFGLQADKGFTIIGVITLVLSVAFTFQFFDYFTRFVAMILSRLHFNISFHGADNIPSGPVIYICYHQAWNETLLLLGSQRRRMRFFIENEQKHSPWMKRLYKMLRVVLIPSIEPLEHNPACLEVIRKSLERGISVCIFVNRPNIEKEIMKLSESDLFHEILQGKDYPIIPVFIEQGEKQSKSRLFMRLMKKVLVPADIYFGEVHNTAAYLPPTPPPDPEKYVIY